MFLSDVPAGEAAQCNSAGRRRSRTRPGNAQAHGPLGDDTLESGFAFRAKLSDGNSSSSALRSVGREEISQVLGQRGQIVGLSVLAGSAVCSFTWSLTMSDSLSSVVTNTALPLAHTPLDDL